MTKLESGAIKANLSAVDISDVLDSVLERVEPLLQEHTIVVDAKGPLVPAWANFSLLEQAVFNVVDNAAKYSPPQSRIEVITTVEDNFVVIFVADEGEGIPKHFSQTIFQKFSRASLGDTKPPGTGLGLVIARGFLELMGGTIRAENKPIGPGAIFTMKVPAMNEIGV
jgi:two-component system sensor histidine kinase KdpD